MKIDLNDYPEIMLAFRGMYWVIYKQTTGDTSKAYMEREWGCKLLTGSTKSASLEFPTEEDALMFVIKRPWETVP